MRLAIVSGGQGWHVRDLQRAAAAKGHSADVVDIRRLGAGIAADHRSFCNCDAVIVRTMPPGSLEQVVFRMDVLHCLEAEGLRVLNPPRTLETCVDKYLATVRLQAFGLRVPATIVCQDAETAMEAFDKLGGDVVVKPLFGSEGRGMVRVSDGELAWRTFYSLQQLSAVIYLQEFVRHPGWDLRVFVIGDRVIAGMRRYAKKGWRTNVAQGGRAEAVRVTSEEERLALSAACAVGAEVAGVDLLPGPKGDYFVLEVNAVPGWRALGPVTGIDVAAEMVRFLTARNKSACLL